MPLPTTIAPGAVGHIGDHQEIHDLVDIVDQANSFQVAQFKVGTYAARPSAGTAGRSYYATNVPALYFDDGSSWKLVAPAEKRATDTASGNLTLTASYVAVPGVSIAITTVVGSVPFWAVGIFEFNISTVGTGTLEGQMSVNGAGQAELAVFNGTPTGGYLATVGQVWEGVCGAAGTQTFTMEAKKSTGSGVADVIATNTNLLVVVFDG